MADEPNKGRKTSAKSVANLRRGNSRGPKQGKDKRGVCVGKGAPAYRISGTQDLSAFCAELFVTKSVEKASLAVGKGARWGWGAMRHPEFLKTYEAVGAKLTEKIVEKTAGKYVMTLEYLDERLKNKLDNHHTHERLGDLDAAKLIEVGYKRCGAIQPAKIVNQANASAQAVGATAFDVYRSQWMIDKQQKMAAQLDAQYPDGPPSSSPA